MMILARSIRLNQVSFCLFMSLVPGAQSVNGDRPLEDMQQLSFIPEEQQAKEAKLRDLEDELRRRRSHYQGLLEQLQRERNRVLKQILSKRYSLRCQAQVFPVTIELRLHVRP